MADTYATTPLTSRTSSDLPRLSVRADVSASGHVLTTVLSPERPSPDAAHGNSSQSSVAVAHSLTGSRRESYGSAMLNSAVLSTIDDVPVRLGKKADEQRDERETWDKKTEFLLAVIGFAVDLGNVRLSPFCLFSRPLSLPLSLQASS